MMIFLVGFMGCGKTYVGKELSKRAKLLFIDLDDLIEKKEKKSITQIFKEEGESTFRLLEQEYLKNISMDTVIVATGGGTPCFFDNMDWMKKNGMVIYLKTNPDILFQRLSEDQVHRPLLHGKDDLFLMDYIENKLEERNTFYEKSSIIYEQKTGKEDIAAELFNCFSYLF